MIDTSTSKSPVWRIFSGMLAFVGWGCGFYASVLFSDAIGLGGYTRTSEVAELFGALPLSLIAFLMMIGAKPRDWRRLGLLLAVGIPLAFWFGLAEDAAQAAQHAITRDVSFFILISTFAMLAMPVFAPVWRIIERTGMTEPDEGEQGWSKGAAAAIAILLPGLMAGTLVVDLLHALSWVQVDSEQAMAWLMAPMFLAALIAMQSARPEGTRDWIMLGGVLAAAMIVGVFAGAGLLSLAQPLDKPTGGTIFLGLANLAAGPLIGWAVRLIATRRRAGMPAEAEHGMEGDEG